MNAAIFSRHIFRRAALASVVALSAFGAASAFAADATATATANVFAPIAISSEADLVFGSFAPGAGGTVTVSTSGDRTETGIIPSTIGDTPGAARFDVIGDFNANYSIDWPATTELTNGAETMALTLISDLTAGNATTGEVTAGTLSGTGTQSIYLGGVLAVGATQAAGDYTGTVMATVEYE